MVAQALVLEITGSPLRRSSAQCAAQSSCDQLALQVSNSSWILRQQMEPAACMRRL